MHDGAVTCAAKRDRDLIRQASDEAADLAKGMPALPPPGSIPGHDIIGEVGRGGMGVVYRAYQRDMKRHVALKVLLHGQFMAPEVRSRFRREAVLAARLQHAGIVRVYVSGASSTGAPFFTMDLVDGIPLEEWARAHRDQRQAILRLFVKICKAVHYAHMRGVIHRDLKPGNILVDREGKPRILDFGLAKAFGDTPVDFSLATSCTERGQVIGTLNYLAPEQAAGKPEETSERTDVYGLGVLLYAMLTGSVPFPTRTLDGNLLQKIQSAAPPPPSRRLSSVDRHLDAIVLKAIQKAPANRYASVEAFGDAVRGYLRHEVVGPSPRPVWAYIAGWLTRRQWATVLVLLCVTCGIGMAIRHGLPMRMLAMLSQPVSDKPPDDTLDVDHVRDQAAHLLELVDVGPTSISTLTARAKHLAHHHDFAHDTCLVYAHLLLLAAIDTEKWMLADMAIERLNKEIARRGPDLALSGLCDQARRLIACDADWMQAAPTCSGEEPPDARYRLSLASLDPDVAIYNALSAVQADDAHLLAWRRLASLYTTVGRHRSAADAAEHVIALGGAPAEWRPRQFAAWAAAADWQHAHEAARRLISECPADARAHGIAALASLCRFEYAAAASHYQRAIECDLVRLSAKPNLKSDSWIDGMWWHYYRATPLWALGFWQEAVAEYEAIIQARHTTSFADARLYLVRMDHAAHLYKEGHIQDAAVLQHAARTQLANARRRQSEDHWIDTVLSCLAGELSPEALIEAAGDDPVARCEAYYYAAEALLVDDRTGSSGQAVAWFEACASERLVWDPNAYIWSPMNEHHLAQWRLRQLAGHGPVVKTDRQRRQAMHEHVMLNPIDVRYEASDLIREAEQRAHNADKLWPTARSLCETYGHVEDACLAWANVSLRTAALHGDTALFQELEQTLQRALDETGDDAAARLLLAGVFVAQGRQEEAQALDAAAICVQEDSADSCYRRSLASLDTTGAWANAQAAVRKDPDHTLAWRRFAWLSYLHRDYDAACSAAKHLATADSTDPSWVAFRLEVLARLGRHEDVLSLGEPLIHPGQSDVTVLRAVAVSYLALGLHERSAATYAAAIRLHESGQPISAGAWTLGCKRWMWLRYYRATPLWILGAYEKAAEEYRLVVAEHAGCSYEDIRLYLVLHDWANALDEQGYHVAARQHRGEAERILDDAQHAVAGQDTWFANIVACIAGQLSPHGLIAIGQTQGRVQLCEAYYYAGERCLLDDNRDEAYAFLQSCVATDCPVDPNSHPIAPMNEYHLARWRLSVLDQHPPHRRSSRDRREALRSGLPLGAEDVRLEAASLIAAIELHASAVDFSWPVAQGLCNRYADIEDACLTWARVSYSKWKRYGDAPLYDEVVVALRRRLEDDPDNEAVRALLAQVLRQSDRIVEADALDADLICADGDSAETCYIRSLCSLDVHLAMDNAQRAVERDPAHVFAWRRLALLQRLNRRYEDAILSASKLVDLDAEPARWLCFRLEMLARLGRFEEVVSLATASGQSLQTKRAARRPLAVAHVCLGNHEEAVAVFSDVLENCMAALHHSSQAWTIGEASWVWPRYYRATPLWILGRHDEAAADYRAVASNRPGASYEDLRLFLLLRDAANACKLDNDDAGVARYLREADEVLTAACANDPADSDWLAQIFDCIADRLSCEELVRQGQRRGIHCACEAYYYAGERCLLDDPADRSGQALAWFEACVATGYEIDGTADVVSAMNEYHLAKWRVAQLTGTL